MSNEAESTFEQKVLELDRLLTLIARKTRARRGDFTRRKLSPPHFILLRTLGMKGSMRSSDIADELRVSRGAISNLTDRLYHEGFIRRVRSREDRRVVEIELTSEGREFLRQKETERIDWLAHLFCQLEGDDLNDLLRISRRIIAVLDSELDDDPGSD